MRTWTNVEKNTWGDGPWLGEPDKVQWIDSTTRQNSRTASLGTAMLRYGPRWRGSYVSYKASAAPRL